MKHNHVTNFGKQMVPKCPRCDELVAEKAAAPAKPVEVQADTPSAKPVEVAETDTSSVPLTGDAIAGIIAAARAPDPEEERERLAKKEAFARSKSQLREIIEQAEEDKRAIQNNCAHRKFDFVTQKDNGIAVVWTRHQAQRPKKGEEPKGETATGICLRCGKEFGPEPAHLHQDAGGVVSGAAYA